MDLNQDSVYQNQSEIDEHLNKKFSEKHEQSEYFSPMLDENKPRHDYTVYFLTFGKELLSAINNYLNQINSK